MASIEDARLLSRLDHGLASVATLRGDGSVQLTVVHAGVVTHPATGAEVGAFVARGGTRKLHHLRSHPTVTLMWRAGWSWVALEGHVDLCGPDDPLGAITPAGIRDLIREISQSAGMQQEDWAEYDRMAAAARHTAVLVTPRRIYQNP